jgi:hypothetical protein
VKSGNVEDVSLIALNGQTGLNERSIEIAVNHTILAESVNGSLDNFLLLVNGVEKEISAVAADEARERTITLSTDDYFAYTDNIKVSYNGNIITSQSGKILDPFAELNIRNTLPKRQILPKKIQAEDFYFNSGLGVEETTDVGGGHNIGYTNPGDYADYLIYAENDKYYQVKIRTAAQNAPGEIGFYLVDENQEETELRTINTPKTGGWQTWETISTSFFIPKGIHTLRMRIINGELNLNWYDFDMLEAVDEGNNLFNQPILYPNPIRDNKLFMKINSTKQQSVNIEIYSLSGQLISSRFYSAANNSIEIDISNIPKGIFIFKTRTEDNIFNQKVIRQ